MELFVIFEKDGNTGSYFISGVANNKDKGDFIARTSLSKGINFSAVSESYEYNGIVDDNAHLYVIYVKDNHEYEGSEADLNREAFGKMFHAGEIPTVADIRIYKTKDSAKKYADTIVSEIVPDDFPYKSDLEGTYAYIEINQVADKLIDDSEVEDEDPSGEE